MILQFVEGGGRLPYLSCMSKHDMDYMTHLACEDVTCMAWRDMEYMTHLTYEDVTCVAWHEMDCTSRWYDMRCDIGHLDVPRICATVHQTVCSDRHLTSHVRLGDLVRITCYVRLASDDMQTTCIGLLAGHLRRMTCIWHLHRAICIGWLAMLLHRISCYDLRRTTYICKCSNWKYLM